MDSSEKIISEFLLSYPQHVRDIIARLRQLLNEGLPGIAEQLDLPARMIAYSDGKRYAEMICAVFPSKKGVKLSFYNGVKLPDPKGLLEGTAKTTRFITFKKTGDVNKNDIIFFMEEALKMYRQRTGSISG